MNSKLQSERKAVEAGGAGGPAGRPLDFWRSVNPIQTGGADYYLPSPWVFRTSYDPGAH